MPEPEYQPVPTQDAQWIAAKREKDIVVILSVDRRYGLTHVTTYGISAQDKVIAAAIGEEIAEQYSDREFTVSFEDFRAIPAAESRATIERLNGEVLELRAQIARVRP